MVVNEESSRAFFEMDNVELIELKKSSTQCPSCLHHVFEGTLICMRGKLIRPNKDVMSRIKEAFEGPKAPCHRTSSIVTRGSRRGPNPWQQHHHKARDLLRSAANGERTFTSIWDRWQHDEIYRKYQLTHLVGSMGQGLRSHRAVRHKPQCTTMAQRKVCSLDSNMQTGPLWKRPGYQEATRELANLQKSEGEVQVLYIPDSDRKRQNNKLDPWLQAWNGSVFIGRSTLQNRKKSERQQTSSSSTWSPSPTWWNSSSWNQRWHKWHSHGWQDDKWSDL